MWMCHSLCRDQTLLSHPPHRRSPHHHIHRISNQHSPFPHSYLDSIQCSNTDHRQAQDRCLLFEYEDSPCSNWCLHHSLHILQWFHTSPVCNRANVDSVSNHPRRRILIHISYTLWKLLCLLWWWCCWKTSLKKEEEKGRLDVISFVSSPVSKLLLFAATLLLLWDEDLCRLFSPLLLLGLCFVVCNVGSKVLTFGT